MTEFKHPFMHRAMRLHLCLIAMMVIVVLTSCDSNLLTGSAQELTGGNGAGLSEYQE